MLVMKIIYERFTKRTLLSILIIHFSLFSIASSYYVSNSGNDSNSGLTEALAWKTLAKVNAASFKPGDQILFKRGDAFYGSLNVSTSGTFGNRITYGAFGTGANPIITGFTTVSAWTNLGNNIWESINAVSTLSTCNMVAINGVNTPMGRYPNISNVVGENAGYLTRVYDAVSKTTVKNDALTGTPDWTGATLVTRTHRTRLDRTTITSQSGSVITFSPAILNLGSKAGFFIQNDIRTLDTQNEWYFNPTTKKISVYSTSQPTDVKVASVKDLLLLSKDYITIENLTFSGANEIGISRFPATEFPHINYLVIQNCSVFFSGRDGIYLQYIDNLIVNNNIIHDSNGVGLVINRDTNVSVTNNDIKNSGIIRGAHWAGGAYAGLAILYGNAINIEGNSIVNTGNNGINFNSSQTTIKNNYVDTFNLIMDDGAGITGHAYSGYNTVIDKNIVINGIGAPAGTYDGEFGSTNSAGIYLDDYSEECIISNNTVANCTWIGIYLKSSDYTTTNGNTVYNCTTQLLVHTFSTTNIHNTMTNNFFVSKKPDQKVASFRAMVSPSFMSVQYADRNYYARPINEDLNTIDIGTTTVGMHVSVDGWKVYSSQDANSHKSPVSITSEKDLQFEYNASQTNKTVSLSRPMIDVKGTKYSTSVTLQPYTSIVLLKDPNPATSVTSTEYKSICEGTNYNGWTTTGTYERTLTTKSGVDSLVTTHLTVNPIYRVTEDINITEGESYIGKTISGTYTQTLSSVTGCDSIVTTHLTIDPLVIKQGSILTKHFIPVWQGQNGINHMNLMVVSATFDDLPLTADDEIAVFSGSNCVGAVRLTVPVDPSNTASYLTISASQDDGSNNGFLSNDTIIFKIWDEVNQKEMVTKSVIYKKDLPTWLSTGKFSAGATSVVGLVSYTEYTQSISLLKGYNMISTYVKAEDPSVCSVTKPLSDQGDLIKVQDEAGNSYEDWGSFGGWINKLGSFQETEGYKIKVAENCTLQVTGRPVVLPLDIPLKTGWNIISFPRTDLVDAMNIIQTLIDQNKLIKVQDEAGNSIEDWGIFGGWKNEVGNFVPGKAYKVKLNADAVLTIQENYTKSAVMMAQSEQTEYFSTMAEGNGTDHMNINVVGLREAGLSVGDELAAFDGTICVGSSKISEKNSIDGTISIRASFSTDDQNTDGFKEGDAIQLFAWNKLTNEESEIQTEVLNGNYLYTKNSSVLVRVKSVTTDIASLENSVTIDVFPNPTSGKVIVRFSTLPENGSSIDILDIAGRKIASRFITGTAEEFNLDGQASGLYFVKTILGSTEAIHKLIVNK
jgi:parallel beta-helix repeat protein